MKTNDREWMYHFSDADISNGTAGPGILLPEIERVVNELLEANKTYTVVSRTQTVQPQRTISLIEAACEHECRRLLQVWMYLGHYYGAADRQRWFQLPVIHDYPHMRDEGFCFTVTHADPDTECFSLLGARGYNVAVQVAPRFRRRYVALGRRAFIDGECPKIFFVCRCYIKLHVLSSYQY